MTKKIPSAKPRDKGGRFKKKETNPIIHDLAQKFYRRDRYTRQYYKAGMFVATQIGPVIGFGFSFCNKWADDRYDYINGIRNKGHGYRMALHRASRWRVIRDYHIGPVKKFKKDNVDFVPIPTFACKAFLNFYKRVFNYVYKKAGDNYPVPVFPIWVEGLVFEIQNKKGFAIGK